MGEVYLAYDPVLARKVAIKVIATNTRQEASQRPDKIARLLYEAQNLAKLSHPNVVPIYDVGTSSQGEVYLAMEFVPGQSFRSIVRKKTLHWREKIECVLQGAMGLAAAHEVGLLHLDFKPENLIVGDDGVTRVLDFGLAKETLPEEQAPDLTTSSQQDSSLGINSIARISGSGRRRPPLRTTGSIAGTPQYMAPEQFRSRTLGPATDIFALGCVLFEALTGALPFPTSPASERLEAVRARALNWPRHVPSWMRDIVGRTLRYRPVDRPTSANEVIVAIRRGLAREARRRKFGQVLVMAALPALPILAWSSRESEPVDPDCRDPQALLESVWNSRVERALAQAFADSKIAAAEEIWRLTAEPMEAWRKEFTAQAAHLCPQHRLDLGLIPFDTTLREQSRACLSQARAELAALIQVWQHPTPSQILGAPSALNSLSKPEECTDVAKLSTRSPLPVDPEARQIALRIMNATRTAYVLAEQGETEKSAALLDEIEDEARNHLHLGSLAGLFNTKAWLRLFAANGGRASQVPIRRAYLWALADDQPTRQLSHAAAYWYTRVYREGVHAESDELYRTMRSATIRGGSTDWYLGIEARNRWIWALTRGESAQATDYLNQMVEHIRRWEGDESFALAHALTDVGLNHEQNNRPQAAYTSYRRALSIYGEKIPAGHPRRWTNLVGVGTSLIAMGQEAAGREALFRAWQDCEFALSADQCMLMRYVVTDQMIQEHQFESAIASTIELSRFERERGTTLVFDAENSNAYAAVVLARRGECEAALEQSHRHVEVAEREGYASVNFRRLAFRNALDVELALGHNASAMYYLQAFRDSLNKAGEASLVGLDLARLEGELALQMGLSDVAAGKFEAWSMDLEAFADLGRQRGQSKLAMARALVRAGEAELANDYVVAATHDFAADNDTTWLDRYELHRVSAGVALAEGEWGRVLEHVERARLIFDGVNVLDDRLGELNFLEAQAWWALDSTLGGRAHARTLAKKALLAEKKRECRGKADVEAIEEWLAVH
jgi:serine/threonine protein kinase